MERKSLLRLHLVYFSFVFLGAGLCVVCVRALRLWFERGKTIVGTRIWFLWSRVKVAGYHQSLSSRTYTDVSPFRLVFIRSIVFRLWNWREFGMYFPLDRFNYTDLLIAEGCIFSSNVLRHNFMMDWPRCCRIMKPWSWFRSVAFWTFNLARTIDTDGHSMLPFLSPFSTWRNFRFETIWRANECSESIFGDFCYYSGRLHIARRKGEAEHSPRHRRWRSKTKKRRKNVRQNITQFSFFCLSRHYPLFAHWLSTFSMMMMRRAIRACAKRERKKPNVVCTYNSSCWSLLFFCVFSSSQRRRLCGLRHGLGHAKVSGYFYFY